MHLEARLYSAPVVLAWSSCGLVAEQEWLGLTHIQLARIKGGLVEAILEY
jgi:hypothetical protein